MAKLIKIETDYRIYAVELTDEQVELYNSGEDGQDEVMEQAMDMDWEWVNTKDGGTDYHLED
jgi:hypothetical protein